MRLIPGTAIAWRCKGPGWRNSGVTAQVQGNDGKCAQFTLYGDHFNDALLSIAMAAQEELEKQFSAALEKGAKDGE